MDHFMSHSRLEWNRTDWLKLCSNISDHSRTATFRMVRMWWPEILVQRHCRWACTGSDSGGMNGWGSHAPFPTNGLGFTPSVMEPNLFRGQEPNFFRGQESSSVDQMSHQVFLVFSGSTGSVTGTLAHLSDSDFVEREKELLLESFPEIPFTTLDNFHRLDMELKMRVESGMMPDWIWSSRWEWNRVWCHFLFIQSANYSLVFVILLHKMFSSRNGFHLSSISYIHLPTGFFSLLTSSSLLITFLQFLLSTCNFSPSISSFNL